MKQPTSITYLATLYLHNVVGQHEFTGRDIINAYRPCHHYLDDKIPQAIWDERAAILAKHDYPREGDKWQQMAATKWAHHYKIWQHDMPDMMAEVKALFKPFTLIDHESIPNLDNYAYSLIANMFKRGHLELISEGPRVYRINPLFTSHPLFK